MTDVNQHLDVILKKTSELQTTKLQISSHNMM